MNRQKTILIINTGGTISSIKTTRGYEPTPGYIKKALADLRSLKHPSMPNYQIKEYSPLLDSSNMTVNHWNQIAEDIAHDYKVYDGFVVLHGTDTMAYTASALSFMLENLGKPVILTGSQIPLSEVRNDASDNIITSLWLCAHQPIPEVCIYFNQRLMRGNRSHKVNAQGFDAFDSPNFPLLASIGTEIKLRAKWLEPKAKAKFRLQAIHPQYIANIRLFPGFMTDILAYLLKQPLTGLILETYGAGNAPNHDKQFLTLLKQAQRQGVLVVNCTQCYCGRVDLSRYATGYTLKKAGVISGQDMTLEAAHCKLLYVLSKTRHYEDAKRLMESNLCGELSEI